MIGIGVDLVEVGRMRDALARTPTLAERLFTPAERGYAESARDPSERFAARFAAKEAVLKALRRGLFSGGVDRALLEIEVVKEGDAPGLRLSGGTLAAAKRLGLSDGDVSLSHAGDYAIATVLFEPEGAR